MRIGRSSRARPPFSLATLARRLGVALGSEAQGATLIAGLASLTGARVGDLAPLLSSDRMADARSSLASAFLVPSFLPALGRPQLISDDPRRSFAELLEVFAPPRRVLRGVHPSAVVDAGAEVSKDAWVGPFCYVAQGARVAAGCSLMSHVHVGEEAVLGEGCELGPHSTVLARCRLGADVILGAGTVIGGDGFGFALDREGNPLRLRSLSTVELSDAVEVGAHSCVDRGTLDATRVGARAKIDNLVQVGHNVEVGEGVLICAQAGLAGSVHVGAGATLGGQAGIADGLRIGARAKVAAKSGVIGDVDDGAVVAGYPARPRTRWAREAALVAQLDDLRRVVRRRSAEAGPGRTYDEDET
ncbi:MAG: UDP-3-O-(3-hydroxymyristoyl)glucosamine N-acyltransferase [Deltaproteobacteria bacterium]|nr:UDP-3-O-(3-hydroxymyristoyl)glucosamine N-acyltransferase [Deltaproteobacteria bacterium]